MESMGYLTCPKGRMSDLSPEQGVELVLRAGSWAAPRVSYLTCSQGRIS